MAGGGIPLRLFHTLSWGTMSLESLPVINFTQCDPSTKNFIKHSVNVFAETLSKWDMQNDDLAIANRIVRRFKNQQRHFIHFAELCHLTRLLRKAGSGRGNFCLNYVIRGLEATEMNQCLSRNCIDFFLLALNSWQSEICVIRALCMSCWRHSERQMLTGHFVKLATLIIIVLARVLILAEKSILSSVEVYSSIYAIRSQVPNVGVAMDCLSRLPKKLEFESVIPLNERCIAFLNLPCASSQTGTSVTAPKNYSVESTLYRRSHELKFVSIGSTDKPTGQTPIVNSQKNSQKERRELLKLLRKSKGKPSKSSNFLEMLFK